MVAVWFSFNKADLRRNIKKNNNQKQNVLRKSTTTSVTHQPSFNEFYNEIYDTHAVARLNIYMCFNYVCACVCVCLSVITSSSDTQPQWAAWLILIHLIRKLTISRMNTDNVGNCCHWRLLTDEFIKNRWTWLLKVKLSWLKATKQLMRPTVGGVWCQIQRFRLGREQVLYSTEYCRVWSAPQWRRGFSQEKQLTPLYTSSVCA